MKEIEILIEVKSSKEDALKALSQFDPKGMKETRDMYFQDPLREDLQPDEEGRLENSLRLRQKGGKNYVAYKKDHFDDNLVWTHSDEHESEIESFGDLLNIFRHLGLTELVDVETKKHVFMTSEYEIVLEEVENLGLFLEIEKLSQVPDEKVMETKQEMRNFLDTLGIEFGEEQNAGKPELLLRKNLALK